MLAALKRYFEQHIEPQTQAEAPEEQLQLAVAALMVEVAVSDFARQPQEREAILALVREQFELSSTQADTLVELAEAEHAQSTDYYQFTALINDHFSQAQKRALIEQLWHVAFADREIDAHETHVIRRLANLLHVPHKAFIAARHRVENPSA